MKEQRQSNDKRRNRSPIEDHLKEQQRRMETKIDMILDEIREWRRRLNRIEDKQNRNKYKENRNIQNYERVICTRPHSPSFALDNVELWNSPNPKSYGDFEFKVNWYTKQEQFYQSISSQTLTESTLQTDTIKGWRSHSSSSHERPLKNQK